MNERGVAAGGLREMGNLREEIARELDAEWRQANGDEWNADDIADAVLGVVAAHLDQHRDAMTNAGYAVGVGGMATDGRTLVGQMLDAALGVVFPREDARGR